MRLREDLKLIERIEKLVKDPIVLEFIQSVYKNDPLKEKIENMQ